MVEIAHHWFLDVDIGPEWLFFRFGKSGQDAEPTPPLAEHAWEVIETHHVFRVVVELETEMVLTSYLVGQLVLLHKRCHQHGGVMRICGFPNAAYDVLKIMRLAERFPNYASRHDAVMGHRPDSE